jgi:hypothetical protein
MLNIVYFVMLDGQNLIMYLNYLVLVHLVVLR